MYELKRFWDILKHMKSEQSYKQTVKRRKDYNENNDRLEE